MYNLIMINDGYIMSIRIGHIDLFRVFHIFEKYYPYFAVQVRRRFSEKIKNLFSLSIGIFSISSSF